MKTLLACALLALPATTYAQTSADTANAVSCRIEGVTPPRGFVFKAVSRPVWLVPGDTELPYVDFSDPKGVWETRRIYLVLAMKRLDGGTVGLGTGIPEERKNYSVDGYVPGLTTTFSGQALMPFAGQVVCQPEALPYVFVHSRAANLALKAPPFTAESFDEEYVMSRTGAEMHSLDQLLGQSCVLGSGAEAIRALLASPQFSKKDTLTLEGSGLSFRIDRWAGCRRYDDEQTYCVDPIIEKNGQKITVPQCPQ